MLAKFRAMLARYRERMQHEHGWEAELRCSRCGADALPVFKGWTPSTVIHYGNTPTIYADLECPRCGEDLREVAGEKLVAMFADEAVPSRNRWLIAQLVGFVVGGLVLIVLLVVLLPKDWRPFAMIPYLFLLQPMIHWFNWRVHSARFHCECGAPSYLFMGLLGRSYCYRCSNCGRLLRLRD